MRQFATPTAILLLATALPAQLVVGNDDTSGGANAWLVDVNTGASTVLWNNYEAWGLAADDAGGVIYVADGSTFGAWPYGSVSAPTTVGTFTDGPGGSTLSMLGLAFGNGVLYGFTQTGSDAIYSVDVATGVCTLVYMFPTTSANYGGLAFNAADGLFYGTNDGAPQGLYSIDALGSGTETLVAPYPGGETDIDGLTIGNGRAYLVTDDFGDDVYIYDLVAGAYVAGIPNPQPGTEIFASGAWAPSLGGVGAQSYCTAKVNSLGCTPAVASSGIPSMSSASSFDVSASMVINNKVGILFYGLAPAAIPFQGGLLCVQPPIRRTAVQASGGNPPPNDCTGSFSFDFNAYAQSGVDPNVTTGAMLYGQYWSRDPLSPSTTSLSDGLFWTMGS